MTARRTFLSIPFLVGGLVRPAEYVALDRSNGRVKLQWQNLAAPIGMGSLQKPFLALAYARTHSSFPIFRCRGAMDQCWLPQGHSLQSVVSALAHSCNAYFLNLAPAIQPGALEAVCLAYGLTVPGENTSPRRLIGLDPGWMQSPEQVVEAFSRLVRDRSNAPVKTALEGMRLAAVEGTARSLHASAYAKTGTALCTHHPRAAGDGFVVTLYPCDQPRIVLLVRQHGTTGAKTASVAGNLLRSLI